MSEDRNAGASFAERIRRCRSARGLSQAELAARVGVSRNAVAGWETGHSRPDLAAVPLLCGALRISLARFFGVEKPRAEQERRLLELFSSLEEGDREVITWQMEALAQRRQAQRTAEQRTAEQASRAPRELVTLFRSDLAVAAGFGLQGQKKPCPPGHGGGHQPDECVSLVNLENGIALYAKTLEDIDGLVF